MQKHIDILKPKWNHRNRDHLYLSTFLSIYATCIHVATC